MNDYYEHIQNRKYSRAIARKRSILLKRRVLMLSIFFIISFIAILSIRHMTYAQDRKASYNKKYQSVMIYCGDSIETITNNYQNYGYSSQNKFSDEICSINNISKDTTLIAGNYLVLPYYESL